MRNQFTAVRHLIHAHHRPPEIVQEKRYTGIIFTALGWLALGLYTVMLQHASDRLDEQVTLGGQVESFLVTNATILVIFLLLSLPRGIKYIKCNERVLVPLRGFIAQISFVSFSLSRVWSSNIDNSVLFTTDAIWLVIMLWFLGVMVNRVVWLGVVVGLIGICLVYSFDLSTVTEIEGAIAGLISGCTLAIITLMTTYMVKRDPPVRIALYHGLIGVIGAAVALLFTGVGELSLEACTAAVFSGLIMSLALFAFLDSFYYTESYVIGVVSYFFPLFIWPIEWLMYGGTVQWSTISGTAVLTMGGLLVIVASYFTREKSVRTLGDGSHFQR